jgi:8-oxo-dGTP diphosphatase
VNDDESTEVGWFDPAGLPELDAMSKLRIDTTLPADAPAWFAKPGEQPPALNQPQRAGHPDRLLRRDQIGDVPER